jgi:hypothetical protein
MENIDNKIEWSQPEIFKLDFKKTKDGLIIDDFEDSPEYVGEQEGS